MPDDDNRESQPIDLPLENSTAIKNGTISEPFVLPDGRGRECVICGAAFSAATSRANVCSMPCRRERKLRYGAVYREDVRDMRAKLNTLFGGQKPTEEQILQLIRNKRKEPK